MTLTIAFPPEMEKTMLQQASQVGQDVNAFVLQAVAEKVAKARTFAEVCAPFAQAVAAAGVSDEEFDRFFEEARDDVWREQQGQQP